MNSVLYSLIFLFSVSLIQCTPVTNCGGSAEVHSVQINECETTPCPLIKNTLTNITVHFQTTKPSTTATTSVHGIIAKIPIPFPVKEPNACQDPASGIKCPVATDTEVEYDQQIQILSAYPDISLKVRWELKGDDDDIFCFEVDATIKDN
ncbi:hypothetical protein SNEBB_005088 [Seison nebaliae]|nr:hypothetical protein SNEBB_005088 [Seison nebaliae]